MRHCVDELIRLFAETFAASEATELVRGDGEPVYLPADAAYPRHRIVFAHGFFASALHEIAHWCIAGRERRRVIDYGYWYKPDGRSPDEQRNFESVEVKPQALEWIFSVAACSPFHFSADNLAAGGSQLSDVWQAFQASVVRQARAYAEEGPPPRARAFAEALSRYFGTGGTWRDPRSYTQ